MTQTSEEFGAAKKRFEVAWDRDDPAHPINDSAEVQRATQVMHLNKDALTRVGVDLQNIAASLAEAQRSGHISISGLNSRLVQIDNTIDAEIQKAKADGVQLDWSALKTAAIDEVKTRLGRGERRAQCVWQPAQSVPRRDGGRRLRPSSGQRRSCRMPLRPSQMAGRAVSRQVSTRRSTRSPAPLYPQAPKPSPMDPKAVEDFKAMVRPELLRQGVPPEQVEAQLNAVVAKAQQGVTPFYRAPEPPKSAATGLRGRVRRPLVLHRTEHQEPSRPGRPRRPRRTRILGRAAAGHRRNRHQPGRYGSRGDPERREFALRRLLPGGENLRCRCHRRHAALGRRRCGDSGGLPVRTLVEGGAPEALVRGWDPTGGMPWDEFGPRFGTPNPESGPTTTDFPPGYQPQPAHAAPGDHHRQVGPRRRRYLAPDRHALHRSRFVAGNGCSEYHRY